MRLINKIKLVFAIELLLIIATVVLAGRFTIDTGTSALRATIEDNLFQHSRDTMMKVETGLNERIDSFREYTSDLILQETLARSNSEFERMEDSSAYIDHMDAEWTAAPRDETTAVMSTIMGNKLSREISEKVAYNEKKFGQSIYGEVFVTNRYGALAASSNRTTGFRQDDEEWWQVARTEGESLIGPYFDESSGKESLAAGIRVDNEDGEFAGVLKVVVDIAFIKSIMKADIDNAHADHKYMQHTLLDDKGDVIYTTGNIDISEVAYLFEWEAANSSLPPDAILRDENNLTVSIHAHPKGFELTRKLGWTLFMTTRSSELYHSVTLIQRSLLVVTAAVILLVVLVGVYATRLQSKYIRRMREAMAHVDAGDIDSIVNGHPGDELTDLATAFKRLTDSIRKSTVSRSYLDELMGNVSTPLMLLHTDGTIKRCNTSAEKTFGFIESEIAGRHISSLIKTGPETDMEAVINNGTTDRLSVTIRNLEDLWLPAIFSCTTVRDDNSGEKEVICSLQDITEQLELEEMISRLSYHDTLTGLPNKQQMVERLGQVMALGQRRNMRGALLMLDLDRFKDVNDAFGHTFGDELLKSVAARLTVNKRSYDTIARLGGDEFAMIILDVDGPADILIVVERVIAALKTPHMIERREIYITPSIGISVFPDDGTDPESIVKYADAAMNLAKSEHREPFKFFAKSMHTDIARRFDMEYRLNKALENDEFLVYYQPEVETGTGRIKAFEALVRWQEPDGGGLIPPGEFIPVAEHTGLIIPLGEWVLKNAATQARAWREMGYTDLRVAVNLSFRQFKKKGFIDTIKRIIEETGADPDSLELELTESILMDDMESVISILVELKAMGVRLAIDDFGTGFSSLAYIKRMPIDKLKIDGSFIRNITTDKDDLAIAVSIIRMSHAMGLEVLAEQVETDAQRELLSTLMCDSCQGFLFSRPTNAKEATDLLVGNRQTTIFPKPVVRA